MKIGCCGFPVAQGRYFAALDAVEVDSSFYKLPRLETARRWREAAPRGFEYSLKAWQLLTHTPSSPTYSKLGRAIPDRLKGRYGHFKQTDEVREAWEATQAVAGELGCRIILFQTPPDFYPNANLLRDMYAFFKSARRGRFAFVWEPRGAWEDALIGKVCRDLELTHGVDPLDRLPVHGAWSYFRLHGLHKGRRIDYSHPFSDGELSKVAALAAEKPAYVFFNNKSMWQDAARLKALRDGAPPRRRGL